MPKKFTETILTEQPTIDWLKELGYDYAFGSDISPGGLVLERKDHKEVILVDRLKRSLKRLNPELSEKAIDEAAEKLITFEHPNLEIVNKEIYRMLIIKHKPVYFHVLEVEFKK